MFNETAAPVQFQQDAAGNCGRYSLANLFNDADFIADLVPGVGQDTFELNRIFRAVRQDVYLTTDYLIPLGCGRMIDHTCFCPDDDWQQEGGCILYIFIVATGKYLHAIGAIMLANAERDLFVVDSLRPQVIRTNAAAFMQQYHVQGMLNFRLDNGPAAQGKVVCWEVSFFNHLLQAV